MCVVKNRNSKDNNLLDQYNKLKQALGHFPLTFLKMSLEGTTVVNYIQYSRSTVSLME